LTHESGAQTMTPPNMPTHFSGSAREVRALDTFIKLSRAVETVMGRLATALNKEGMTASQLAVLEALLHLGPLSQRDLGRKLLRSNPNVTAVLDNLEKQGLVKRERSTDDRRLVNVSLTREGRRRIETVFPAHARRIAELMGALTPEEQEQLARLCKKLGVAAAADRGL
jgi:MarR family 2-MHQ and catechol resistance regulon transcriptional repressor